MMPYPKDELLLAFVTYDNSDCNNILERDTLLNRLSEESNESGISQISILNIVQETKRKRVSELDKLIEALRDEYHK